jgi:octaprenyl-diphosphate synthase
VIAEAGDEAARAMAAYGMNLGLAFQLVDDVLDYDGSAAALGKNVGDDFREGKITLPVILAYASGAEDERAFWRGALEDGGNDDAALVEARRLLERHGALDATKARARHYGRAAAEALGAIPPSESREALHAVVEFCIERIN